MLRVDADGIVRVTVPRGGTESFALRFVESRQDWIRRQMARLEQLAARRPQGPWVPGTPVWYRGEPQPLVEHPPGLRLGDLVLPPPRHPGVVVDWRPHVEAALRTLAQLELPILVRSAADRHGLTVGRVSIRSQRTRWGSCSRRGTISLNWRLVQLPPQVRDYLVAHELAHLRQMNHSARFWAVVDTFFPAWREAEAWLKRHGREVLARES